MKEKLSLKVLLLVLLVVIPFVKINGESITQQKQLNAVRYMPEISSTLNNQIFTLDLQNFEITIPPGESLTFFLEPFSFPESAAMDNVTVFPS